MPIETEILAKIEANKRQWRESMMEEKNSETAERQESFRVLKEGIIKKFVANELDLEDRQEQSILKLVDQNAAEDVSLSHGYFHACTAFGKTYLMMAMAEGYHTEDPHKKIIILEENIEVLEQVKQDFIDKTDFSVSDIGAFYGKEKTADTPIVVGTYASMEKMINAIGKENIGLVLCDEAHHILSENRRRVAQIFNNSCLYGFTATPEYDKDKNCANVFGKVIDSVTLREGVEEGLLCSFKNGLFISKIPVDLTDAINRSGDYDGEKLAEIFKQSHLHGIREELADYYLNASDPIIGQIKGKPTIINVPNQHEANELAAVFNHTAGYNIAQAYHTNSGESPLQEFNAGKFPVLIQVNRITEGYSNKKVELCINYPTASKVRAAQRGGRALRKDRENPDKVALIMDIAFKRSNNKSTLEEIRENGQVLFMDIAEDVTIISSNMRQKIAAINKIPSKNKNKDKEEIDTTHLFDVVVNVEDLYDMTFTRLIHEEENTPQRNKLDTDLGKEVFRIQWTLRQDGKSLRVEEKGNLWDQIYQANPELFIFVQSGSRQAYVISKEQQNSFKQYLQAQGYDVTAPDEKIKGIVKRNKLDTDLVNSVFQNLWTLRQDGKSLRVEEKSKLWDQIYQANPEFFTFVQSARRQVLVISKERQNSFKQYLQERGYDVTTPNEKIKGIVKRNKLDTDLVKAVFHGEWLLKQNGKSLRIEEKSKLWEQIYQANPELFTFVQSRTQQAYVISKEQQNSFKQYLQERGYDVTTPNEKIKGIVKRNKLDTDLVNYVFQRQWILQQNGKSLRSEEKNSLWKQIYQTNPELFTCVQSKSQQAYVISKEQQKAFKQYLQEQGYDVTTSYDKLHAAQEQAAQAKNQEDRKKYLAIAKKIFETLNPKIAKDKTCKRCLNKISQSRE